MQYALLIYENEVAAANAGPEAMGKVFAAYGALEGELAPTGKKLGGEALEPTSTATCVRIRNGDRTVTDGPFAETKEQLGGFYLLDCADMDEALDWAAKIPTAKTGTIEIRPVMDVSALMNG